MHFLFLFKVCCFQRFLKSQKYLIRLNHISHLRDTKPLFHACTHSIWTMTILESSIVPHFIILTSIAKMNSLQGKLYCSRIVFSSSLNFLYWFCKLEQQYWWGKWFLTWLLKYEQKWLAAAKLRQINSQLSSSYEASWSG